MPERTYLLEIVTPEQQAYSGSVTSLTAPGEWGYLGVWANHAPMLVALRTGVLTFREVNGTKKRIAISGGFLEVASNHAVVLADSVEFPEDVDVGTEMKNLREARHAMLHPLTTNMEPAAAAAAVELARAKLKMLEPDEP